MYIYIYFFVVSTRASVITRLLFKRDDEAVYEKRRGETDPEIQDGKKGRRLTQTKQGTLSSSDRLCGTPSQDEKKNEERDRLDSFVD